MAESNDSGSNGSDQSGVSWMSSGWTGFFLAALCVFYALIAIQEVALTWSGKPRLVPWLIGDYSSLEQNQQALIAQATFTSFGAVIGATLISLKGLHRYVSEKGDLRPSYIGSYVIGPWGAGVLGFSVFALVQGGLLAFSTSDSAADQREAAYLALGILAGFGWRSVGAKIEEVIETLFSTKKSVRTTPSSGASSDSESPPPTDGDSRSGEAEIAGRKPPDTE
ncbi:MAG: hypothetical protein AAFQ22_01795 [Pseudomonadota bacterium]